jgi:hypothetical protein
MRVVELGGLEIVARALEVALRDHVDAPGVLRALELAFGRDDLHFRKIAVLAAFQYLAADFDGLAIESGIGAGEPGALAIEFVRERGARDDAEHIARLDHVTGAHLVDDRAGRFREQGRADGGHHEPRGGDVAHERAARDDGGAQTVARDHFLGRQPRTRAPDEQHQQYERRAPDIPVPFQESSAAARSGDALVLLLGTPHRDVAQKHGHGSVKALCVPTAARLFN